MLRGCPTRPQSQHVIVDPELPFSTGFPARVRVDFAFVGVAARVLACAFLLAFALASPRCKRPSSLWSCPVAGWMVVLVPFGS